MHELSGAPVRYAITGGQIVVMARSSLHDTRTVWRKLGGSAEAEPGNLAAGATLDLTVDMTDFDAGDFLKNRKLRKDLDLDRHREASFRLTRLDAVAATDAGFTATAVGTLRWHGRELEVSAAGSGRLDAAGFTARASFELDVTRLGITPPRILMFKVEEVVSVEVELSGRAG